MKTLEEMETGLNLEALKQQHDDDNSTSRKETTTEEPALVINRYYIFVLLNGFTIQIIS